MSGTPATGLQLSPQEMAKLSNLLVKMSQDAKTRPHLAHLVKHVSPGDANAFQDVFMRQEMAAFKKGIDDERQQEKMARVKEAFDNQKRSVAKKRGFSDEQMGEVAKIQEHYGLSDWDAAADIYAQRNPPEDPTLKPPPEMRHGGSTWEFPTVEGTDHKPVAFKDYIQNPRKYSNDLAFQMIGDFKRGKLPSVFQAR